MKKFLVPSLLMLFATGLAQQEAKAGSFSIGISIGDDHRRYAPPIVYAPPQVISRPAVVCAEPQVVVVQPRRDDCDRGYAYVRECEHPYGWRYGHYRHAEHDRYERHDRG